MSGSLDVPALHTKIDEALKKMLTMWALYQEDSSYGVAYRAACTVFIRLQTLHEEAADLDLIR